MVSNSNTAWNDFILHMGGELILEYWFKVCGQDMMMFKQVNIDF